MIKSLATGLPVRPVLSSCLLFALVLTGCGLNSLSIGRADSADSIDSLRVGFSNPPQEARPRAWWHWMNGNISQEGIIKDLEWMQRVGIGGVQMFDAAMETPTVVPERLVYMSEPWKEAFRSAVVKAEELGLEFAIASSAGWSLTGGPWVSADDAMKKLVWSEMLITGGERVQQRLPLPPATVGAFQTLPASYKHGHNPEAIPDSFYRDTLVLAYPVDRESPAVTPKQIKVNGVVEAAPVHPLVDGNILSGIPIPGRTGQSPGSIEFVFRQETRIQSASIFVKNLADDFVRGTYQPTLQAYIEDEWQTLANVDLGNVPSTISFNAIAAKKFRLLFTRDKPSNLFQFKPAPGIDSSSLFGMTATAKTDDEPLLTDFRLFATAKVDAFEVKAGFRLTENYHDLNNNKLADVPGIEPGSILDISSHMTADGVLQWDAPAGLWKILRLGYSLTGKTNSPATDEATGLEVDKYDNLAVTRYLDNYLGMYQGILGDELIGDSGLTAMLTDSTEVGPSNWTPTLLKHFKAMRGYDPVPWLPVLTGEVVGARSKSDAFLYDFRRTLAELGVEQHYGTLTSFAHERGIKVYSESLEGNRIVSTLGDDLEMRRFADIPMAAMWAFGKGEEAAPHYIADMRGAASVAHIYGQNLAAAESLTSILQPWAHAPSDLQPMIDAEFLQGINRPVIHTSPHQPVEDKVPGLSLHVFGQYFTRHETWAEMAKPWIDYISRNSYLLQQGRFVADVAYFYGEEPPIGVLAGTSGYPSDVPVHYGYDFLPPHAVMNELFVDDGKLLSPGGASYEVLFLGESSRAFMTLPVLKRMYALVEQGATLVGLPPESSPSLADDEEVFTQLVKTLWGDGATDGATTALGKGRVIRSTDIEKVLNDVGLVPDVALIDSVRGEGGVQQLPFVHRQLADGDMYYVANRGQARQFDALFRSENKVPEIWRADTGTIEPVAYKQIDGQTRVSLDMNAWESFFVVFNKPMTSPSKQLKTTVYSPLQTISSPWAVQFEKGRGAPSNTSLTALYSLSEHKDAGIRYFSGVSSYRNSVNIETSVKNRSVLLDLGRVGDIAEVYVNGEYAGAAWKAPYRVDITQQLVQGKNQLDIKVANLWVNRLVGDRQSGEDAVTYTTFKTYLPNAPLRPSGLIGPVKVLVNSTIDNRIM